MRQSVRIEPLNPELRFGVMADDSEHDRLLEEADRSYEEGDYEAAFAAFSQLADAGDAPAQTKLGDM